MRWSASAGGMPDKGIDLGGQLQGCDLTVLQGRGKWEEGQGLSSHACPAPAGQSPLATASKHKLCAGHRWAEHLLPRFPDYVILAFPGIEDSGLGNWMAEPGPHWLNSSFECSKGLKPCLLFSLPGFDQRG